jgi:3'(2'), 5'-bisphosphate nucleotidase
VAKNKAIDAALVDALTGIVSQAAAAVLVAKAGALDMRLKADQSPVTAADESSEAIILSAVGRLLPGVPIISEEAGNRVGPDTRSGDYVLVDPLDGTRELLAGRDEFTINLALVSGGAPVLGIVAAPALGLIWRTTANGGTAERLRFAPGAESFASAERAALRTRPRPTSGLVAAVSRSHADPATEAFLARFGEINRMSIGSAIKFCRVAEGTADIYPRLSPTYQWDAAAGHAVLAAAGGVVTTPQGTGLAYALEPGQMIIPGFVAWGDPSAVIAADH